MITDNTTETTATLPEAPASVTYSVTTPHGFDILFTLRDTTGLGLLDKMESVENYLLNHEYKPQIKRSFGAPKKEQEFVEGKVCPKDGGRLVKKVTKAGKPYHKCENGKWNPTTNQAMGCPFVDWLDQG
jgi:hypothetical protein